MFPPESHEQSKVAHETLETKAQSTDCKVSKHSQLPRPVLHTQHTAHTQAVHPPMAGRLPRKDRCHWCGVKEVGRGVCKFFLSLRGLVCLNCQRLCATVIYMQAALLESDLF